MSLSPSYQVSDWLICFFISSFFKGWSALVIISLSLGQLFEKPVDIYIWNQIIVLNHLESNYNNQSFGIES